MEFSTPMSTKSEKILSTEQEAKMKQEWAKIRSLEHRLGNANKKQQVMTSKMYDHKMKMESQLNKAELLEEEKREVTKQYDLKNKRGLTSQTAAKPKSNISGKAIFKSKAQMAAEAEARIFGGGADGSDTFLTDLMQGKKKEEKKKLEDEEKKKK